MWTGSQSRPSLSLVRKYVGLYLVCQCLTINSLLEHEIRVRFTTMLAVLLIILLTLLTNLLLILDVCLRTYRLEGLTQRAIKKGFSTRL